MSRIKENRPLTSIRGLAALWVFGFHVSMWSPSRYLPLGNICSEGAWGVDVFFILSGFIMSIAYPKLGRASLPSFFRKRVARIYPLHLAVMLALGAATLVAPILKLPLNHDSGHSWSSYPLVLFLIQPFFDKGAAWNGPSWSLSVELFCYLLFPWMRQAVRRWSTRALQTGIGVLAISQFIFLLKLGAPLSGFEAVLRGLIGFSLGMVVQEFRAKYLVKYEGSLIRGAVLMPLAILVALFTKHGEFVPGLSALLIAALSFNQGILAKALSSRIFHWLGSVSFSFYLVQQPVLLMLRNVLHLLWTKGRIPLSEEGFGWLFFILSVVLILAMSQVTYEFIEKPGRRLGMSGTSREKSRVPISTPA